MASLLAPFSGFIPAAEFARRIVGPPTSMLTREQKNASRDDELSFRHVVGRGARANQEEAAEWLQRCSELDSLQAVESAVIVHRSERGGVVATGIIAQVSVAAYDDGLVKPHEKTVPKTERKMLDYMQSTRILGNPVALAHHDHVGVAAELETQVQRTPDLNFESIDGTEHSLWIVTGEAARSLCGHFNDVLYVTDGHHRLAAASSLAAVERRPDLHIPAGLFAESELQVGAFARTIKNSQLVGQDVLKALSERFELERSDLDIPRPLAPHEIGVRIDRHSFVLTIPQEMIPSDTYDGLAVNLLQSLVLEPLIGISDPRQDARLQFIADTSDDAHDVDSYDAWFLPYPVTVGDVMTVADAGRSMPPKSTYFLPKIPSGLAFRLLDQ